MRRIEKVIHSVKKIWRNKHKVESPAYFNKYIDTLDKGLMLESVAKFGTPQYYLDKDSLASRGRFFRDTFRRHIPNCELFYAMKCNDLPIIAKTLKNIGFNADVAGLFELKLALRLGFQKIIFTSPGKDDKELSLAMKNDVILNIDNPDELDNIIRLNKVLKKTIRVSIRVNPDSSITKVWSKYGMDFGQLSNAVIKIRKDKRIKLIGLHFHSSWNRTSEKYLKKIALLGDWLSQKNPRLAKDLEFLDLGGGFFPEDVAVLMKYSLKGDLVRIVNEYHEDNGEPPKINFKDYEFRIREVDPLDKIAKEIGSALEKHVFPLNPGIRIYFEPGRFIVTHSTSILMRVAAIKRGSVIVDAGVNLLGDYRFEEFSFAPIVSLSSQSRKIRRKKIYGPLCDPSDLWGFTYYGDSIKKGDVLAVLHQGAYTFSCAWRFIKPTAAYISSAKGKLMLAKKQESFEDRYSGCRF